MRLRRLLALPAKVALWPVWALGTYALLRLRLHKAEQDLLVARALEREQAAWLQLLCANPAGMVAAIKERDALREQLNQQIALTFVTLDGLGSALLEVETLRRELGGPREVGR